MIPDVEYSNEAPQPLTSAKVFIVAVYDCSLTWGGPEEGGWWYDSGSIVRICKTFRNYRRAVEYCYKLNTRLHSRKFGPNQGKRDKSSVLSDGMFEAHLMEGHAPRNYPEVRPHYE